jgi:hypothetical protein
MAEETNLTEFLEQLRHKISGDGISLGDIVAAFKQRGFGPLLLAPALIALLPTGAIPGVPTMCALFICLVNGQQLVGLEHPWLPGRLRRFSIGQDKFDSALAKAKPVTKRIDRFICVRWTELIEPPIGYLITLLSIGLALLMIPLEVVPFAAAVPALAIAFFALALIAKDGALIIIGLMITVAAAVISFVLLR